MFNKWMGLNNINISKKILSLYLILSLLTILSPVVCLSDTPEIEITSPANIDYVTNNSYINISVDIEDTSNVSSFINLDNNLKGYWNFEHNTSDKIIDNSSFGNNATFNGSLNSPDITLGKFGHGFLFNGSSNNYLDCGKDNSLDIDNEITIEAWLKENETTFFKTFGYSDNDYGYSVEQTSDGGYILTGEVNYTGGFNTGDIYLLKTDSNGNEEWNRTFDLTNDSDEDYGQSIQITDDNGYIITGITDKTEEYNGNVLIFKTNKDGRHSWNYSFGYDNYDFGYEIQQVDDGYILTGIVNKTDDTSGDLLLLKRNENGSHNWSILFEGNKTNDKDCGQSVKQTDDGGYIIAGSANFHDSNYNDVWLIKTDRNGTHLWNTTFWPEEEGPYSDWGADIQLINGGYIITGGTSTNSNDGLNPFLIKTNDSGIVDVNGFQNSWEIKNSTEQKNDAGFSVKETTDNGYIIAGYWNYDETDGGILLMKINNTGVKQWHRSFTGNNLFETGYDVEETRDGGFILIGNGNTGGNKDIWLIKTNSSGHITYLNNNQSRNKTIVGKGRNTYQLELHNGTISGYINNNATVEHTESLYNLSQQWNHIVFTYDSSYGSKLYMNGQLKRVDTNYTGQINSSINNLTIGNNFGGIIDEVKIWNRTLSHNEINASYNTPSNYSCNFTNLSERNYSYYVYAINSDGNENNTGLRNVTVDFTSPISNITNISSYRQNTSYITLNASASDNLSGIKNVTLYYYNSSNNFTWSGPWNNGKDNSSPYQWNFNFPNGSGYYRFYSIAVDNASNIESAPSTNDTECYFSLNNSPPNTSTIISPSDGSSVTTSLTTLSWNYAGDPDGDDTDNATYDIYFEKGDTTPDILKNSGSNSTSYSASTSTDGIYYWRIITYDNNSIGTLGPIWSFTKISTGGGIPPPPADESEDEEDNETTESIVNDSTGPTIIINSPKNNKIIYDKTPMIKVSYSDPSGINTSSIIFTLDGIITTSNTANSNYLSYTAVNNMTIGVHTVSISVSDSLGNSASETWSFMIENIEYIDDQLTVNVTNKTGRIIQPTNKSKVNKVIKEMEINFKRNITNVSFEIIVVGNQTIQDLPNLPRPNSKQNYTLYKYLNLSITANGTYLTEDDIKSAILELQIPVLWIKNNSINLSSIKLLRYYNNQWQELNALLSGNDSSYYYFTVESPGFSTFAVVGNKVVDTPSEPTKPELPWLYIIGSIIVLVIILLFILFKAGYIYVEEVEE